jgi:Casein kinase II regulatory subunit
MGVDTVKIYCPKCSQVFHPPPLRSGRSITTGGGSAGGNGGIGTMSAGVDGAAFGTTFPHLFLMTFSNLVPDPLPPESAYVPRIFGFRVHKSSRQRFATSSSTPTSTALSVAPTTATTSQQQLEISSSNANIDANLAAGHNNAIADDDVATPNNNDDRKISAIAALDDDDDDENSQSPRPMQQQIHITKPLSNLKPLNEVLDTEAVAGPAAESEIQQSELGNGSEREKQMMLGGIHTTKRSRTSSTTDNNGGSLVVGFLAENSTKRRRRTNPSSSTTPNT